MLIGLPGAGKSSFHRSRYGATHVHVSKDLLGHRARRKDEKQMRLVEMALGSGRSVVVDNTNLRVADRAPLIAAARAGAARVVGYFFEATAQECLARNRTREGKARVTDVAIHVSRYGGKVSGGSRCIPDFTERPIACSEIGSNVSARRHRDIRDARQSIARDRHQRGQRSRQYSAQFRPIPFFPPAKS